MPMPRELFNARKKYLRILFLFGSPSLPLCSRCSRAPFIHPNYHQRTSTHTPLPPHKRIETATKNNDNLPVHSELMHTHTLCKIFVFTEYSTRHTYYTSYKLKVAKSDLILCHFERASRRHSLFLSFRHSFFSREKATITWEKHRNSTFL